MKVMRRIAFIGILLALASCKPDHNAIYLSEDAPYELTLPDHFPEMDIPDDNALTQKRVELGQRLFFDTRLSRTGTVSCGSCHIQEEGFADVSPFSFGVDGIIGPRNAPSLGNIGFHPRLNGDGGVPNLELQVLVPLHDEREMDFNNLELVELLQNDVLYQRLSKIAYDRPLDTYVITRALAAFERTLISGNSKYDRVLQGLEEFSPEEQNGYNLFTSEATQCSSCHSGILLSDFDYANIGLYLDYQDLGRQLVTADPADGGAFKTPPLRNVAVTEPYMHDGSLATLSEVLAHFNGGGAGHPNQDPRIQPLGLTPAELSDLEAFLNTLTDSDFLVNPEYFPLD